MPDDDVYMQFARAQRAVVVAPAGCGKTELIARAVDCCPSDSKQLVLTHTHAGVDALRARLRKIDVPASRYHVETIHSFALRYAAAYPQSSAIPNTKPRTNKDYSDVIESAQKLIKTRLVREVLRLSYAGMFVDEYQDCSLDQHDLILGLAETLPCRIVGDPLQGIFDFGGNHIVDWDQHVYPFFTRLPDLAEPWRWKNTNPELGKWLTGTARLALERKEPLPLGPVLQAGICTWTQEVGGQYGPATRVQVLISALNHDETTFVICRPEQEHLPHKLASNLKNCYHSIEPITSDELCALAEAIEACTGVDRLCSVHAFCAECLTALQDFDAVLQAVRGGTKLKAARRRDLYKLACCVVGDTSIAPVAALLDSVGKNGNPTIKRYQLWHEMRKALSEVTSGTGHTLVEAANLVRNRGAIVGRRIPKRCISRTVLLKGLECEQAIIIDTDSMDTKNLYVALTRGSRNLHVMSREKILWASDARRSCPKCHSQLAWRTGPNGAFLGCSTYPACSHTESISREQQRTS